MLFKLLKNIVTGQELKQEILHSESSFGNDSLQVFSHTLLTDFFKHANKRTENNYDYLRYSHDGVDRSNDFNAEMHASYMHLYFNNAERFHSACTRFDDAYSRELFCRLVLYRMLGHLHVVISDGSTWESESRLFDKAREYDAGPSHIGVSGLFGPIRHYEGIPAHADSTINLDGWSGNIVYTALKKQYYFSRNGVSIAPESGDIVMDAGACFGDTAVYFATTVGSAGHVYAFDPLPSHNRVIDFNIQQNNLTSKVTPVCSAVGDVSFTPAPDRNATHATNSQAVPGFSLLAGNFDFPVTTLDNYFKERNIPRVDFIKMDIEGFELPALTGAMGIIERFKPKLAISLYHKLLDIVDIPLWLAQNFPFYDLYLDHYTIHNEETVLYAIARR